MNYIDIVKTKLGEDETFAKTLLHMLKNKNKVIKVAEEDKLFNYYEDIHSWNDLHEAIIDDVNIKALDIDLLIFNNKEDIRKKLIDENWAIDFTTNIAIGFDDDIILNNHEIRIV